MLTIPFLTFFAHELDGVFIAIHTFVGLIAVHIARGHGPTTIVFLDNGT